MIEDNMFTIQAVPKELGELVIIGRHFKYGKGDDFVKVKDHESIIVEKNKQLTIGRSETNSLIIDHTAVSSVHCRIWSIQFDGDSIPLIYLKDTSLNGTYLNGKRLMKNQVWLLSHGDVITVKFGVSLKFLSIFGDNELNYGKSLILNDNIQTQFKNWTVKERVIGNGTFGHVFICEKKFSGKLSAVKIIKYKPDSSSFESNVLSKLNHVRCP